MRHVGGPETPEAIRSRQERYLRSEEADGGLFAIVAGPERVAVGWVGYWHSSWDGEDVWECGWPVLPEYQSRGIASAGTALMIERVRTRSEHRWLHAFPSVDNAASNALCGRLGFTLVGPADVEYPPGHMMKSNDWRMDLLADRDR